jgi:uncharacterized LabA/DUF88 family protein
MKTFAFIDVQNTETTALKVLNFIFDWQKLIDYLETRWSCEKIFFYPGIQENDEIRKNLFLNLIGNKSEVVVSVKEYRVYKNQDKVSSVVCPNCKMDVVHKVDMGYSWKCNCDVELTADVLDHIDKDAEIFLFSGDGDFEFLIKKVVAKGCRVTIVSSAKMISKGPRYSISRLSTKLRKLTRASGSPVRFIEIDNLKFQIKKDV